MGGQPVWIAADDGTRLCADLYLPPGDGPWPVLLDALPYRMHDVTASSAGWYRTLAAAGFAVCRLDLRGTGSSGGTALAEHPEVDRDDLRGVIAWLCAQPWCTGRAGLFGTSHSGSIALQVAAAEVPGLDAVVVATTGDDRVTDGAHRTGGVLRAIDLVADAARMVAMTALPPVPAVYGDGWDDEWRKRIDGTEPWVLRWLRAPVDDSMQGGAIRPRPDGADHDRITCPTLLVAGWGDGADTTTFGTARQLRVPWRLLVGPWSHADRLRSHLGPTIDADGEVVAFLDEHLRGGRGTGAAAAQVFVRRPARPDPGRVEHPGAWRQAGTWPPPGWRRQVLTPTRAGIEELDVVADVGTTVGSSGTGALPWVQPSDQRIDDARALTHDWSITELAELVGSPSVHLRVRSSAPVAQVAVKLCDVLPDGTSALITRGLLNLAHRDRGPAGGSGSHGRRPTPVVPGEWWDVDIDLGATTWTLQPGHVLRLVVAGSDWPTCWPPPTPVRLGLDWSAAALTLPVWDAARPADHAVATGAGLLPVDDDAVWRIEHDVLRRETKVVASRGGRSDGDFGAVIDASHAATAGVSTIDPGRAWARGHTRYRIEWPELTCTTEAVLEIRSDAAAYDVTIDLAVSRDGLPFAHRQWTERIRRDLR